MAHERESFPVEVAGLKRNFPLFAVAPGVRIAIVNILGDTELITTAAAQLAEKLRDHQGEVIITAEAKSIPLAFELGRVMGLPWVVLRKAKKPYMGETMEAETLSITTGQPQTLYLDEKDRVWIKGRGVIIVDDVISTGSTLQGIQLVIEKAGGTVAARAAIFTEGDRAKWQDIVALGHLPVFAND
jgi:adenine phosphoribosyltransferase